MNVLGVDPGRLKLGVAAVGAQGEILWRAIFQPDALEARLPAILEQWQIELIALGHSTACDDARAQIERVIAGLPVELRVVNERGSTLEARPLYWADHPPQGWRRIVPLSLQEPPEPLDDYAAVVVARRALAGGIAGDSA